MALTTCQDRQALRNLMKKDDERRSLIGGALITANLIPCPQRNEVILGASEEVFAILGPRRTSERAKIRFDGTKRPTISLMNIESGHIVGSFVLVIVDADETELSIGAADGRDSGRKWRILHGRDSHWLI